MGQSNAVLLLHNSLNKSVPYGSGRSQRRSLSHFLKHNLCNRYKNNKKKSFSLLPVKPKGLCHEPISLAGFKYSNQWSRIGSLLSLIRPRHPDQLKQVQNIQPPGWLCKLYCWSRQDVVSGIKHGPTTHVSQILENKIKEYYLTCKTMDVQIANALPIDLWSLNYPCPDLMVLTLNEGFWRVFFSGSPHLIVSNSNQCALASFQCKIWAWRSSKCWNLAYFSNG